MLDYICRYRKYYPGDSREAVLHEIPMQEGYAMISGAMSMDGFLFFSGLQIEGGYIRSEIEKLKKAKKC